MRQTVSIKGSASQAVRANLLKRVAVTNQLLQRLWRNAVLRTNLSHQAKVRYCNAIQPYPDKLGVYLSDKVAKLLETGWKPFDMRPGLLKGMMRRVIPMKGPGGATEFRTVSNTSPHGSWYHPGYKGANVLKDLQKRLDKLVAEATSGG